MKYLVTGVAGFIGSHLAERLIAQGEQVVGIDCFTDFYPLAIKEGNLRKISGSKNFELLRADLRQLELKPLLQGVDRIFHLAAQAGVRTSWGRDFDHYLENNIKVTQRLLEAMLDFPELKMVFASTSSVYGDTDRYPTPENAAKRPFSPYGVTKLACESLCYLYYKNFGTRITLVRFFTVFGARQRPDMAFHKFIRATLCGEPIPIYGDGTQTRDYTYIQDIIDGAMAAMDRGTVGEAYNLGGGHQTRLMDAVKMIFELCGKSTEIKYLSPQKGDVRETLADTEKARKELGYAPRGSVELGLKEEIDWVREIITQGGS